MDLSNARRKEDKNQISFLVSGGSHNLFTLLSIALLAAKHAGKRDLIFVLFCECEFFFAGLYAASYQKVTLALGSFWYWAKFAITELAMAKFACSPGVFGRKCCTCLV